MVVPSFANSSAFDFDFDFKLSSNNTEIYTKSIVKTIDD